MFLGVFLGIVNILKLWLASYLPLLGDEAYYSLWSKHPALSYVDHPPLIALMHGLTNFIFGQTQFGIRFVAIICLLISTGLIYLIGKEAFGKRIGIASAVLFNLIPTYFAGGFYLTPEQPLQIFWLLSLYLTLRIVKEQKKSLWYLLGIAVGLGLLSKYTMILFIPGLLLFLLLSKENRHWFRRKEPYLASLISLIIFTPVIIWNIQHGFPALLHHGSRLGSPDYLNNLLYFFVLQFLMYSPPLFIFVCSSLGYKFWQEIKQTDNLSLLLITIAIPGFLAFLLVSPFTLIGGHWTSTLYLGLIVLLCHRALTLLTHPWRSFRLWLSLSIIVLLNLLLVVYYAFLFPIPAELKDNAYTINRELAQYIEAQKVDYVFSNQMGVAGLVAFFGRTEVYLPQGKWRQFDIWGQPKLKKGDDIIYFVFSKPKYLAELKQLFKQITVDRKKRIYVKESGIPEKTMIIICRGYKGGKLP